MPRTSVRNALVWKPISDGGVQNDRFQPLQNVYVTSEDRTGSFPLAHISLSVDGGRGREIGKTGTRMPMFDMQLTLFEVYCLFAVPLTTQSEKNYVHEAVHSLFVVLNSGRHTRYIDWALHLQIKTFDVKSPRNSIDITTANLFRYQLLNDDGAFNEQIDTDLSYRKGHFCHFLLRRRPPTQQQNSKTERDTDHRDVYHLFYVLDVIPSFYLVYAVDDLSESHHHNMIYRIQTRDVSDVITYTDHPAVVPDFSGICHFHHNLAKIISSVSAPSISSFLQFSARANLRCSSDAKFEARAGLLKIDRRLFPENNDRYFLEIGENEANWDRVVGRNNLSARLNASSHNLDDRHELLRNHFVRIEKDALDVLKRLCSHTCPRVPFPSETVTNFLSILLVWSGDSRELSTLMELHVSCIKPGCSSSHSTFITERNICIMFNLYAGDRDLGEISPASSIEGSHVGGVINTLLRWWDND
jgi:hypothetical protein